MTTFTTNFFEASKLYIPGGVNSPVRSCSAVGMEPIFPARGKGAYIFDHEGRPYLDFVGSWGVHIHGHSHPEIVAAIHEGVDAGCTFGMPTLEELKLAEKIVSKVSCIEKIRFVSSGTEATMSALRLARAYTSRTTMIKFNGNYHGHADPFLVKAGSGVAALAQSSSLGVPDLCVKDTISLPYNDAALLRRTLREAGAACVIVEPIAANMGVVLPSLEFLDVLVTETKKTGALLIFDEVITGFRLGIGGASALFGVTPDLVTYGKIIGGGLPAAVFGGKREIMDWLAPDGPVYQAGTLSGNPIAMRAGLKALELLEVPGFYEALEEKGRYFEGHLREALGERGCVQRAGSLLTLFMGKGRVDHFEDAKGCDLEAFSSLYCYLRERGVLIPPSQFEAWFLCCAHTFEDLARTAKLVGEWGAKNNV